jgi:hypothetical protein
MDLDFDSDNDCRIFGQALRSTKIIEIIKSLSALRPIEVFRWIVNRIQTTFNVRPNVESLDSKQMLRL